MTTVHEIQLRLEALYKAGRNEFPDKAGDVSQAAARLESAIDRLNGLSAQVGDCAPLANALAVCHDVHTALGRAVQTLNDSAVGLVHIADDFAETDAQSREAFGRINKALTTDGEPPWQAEVPSMPDPTPPGQGDEFTSAPPPVDPDTDREERDDRAEDAAPEQPEIPS